MANRVMVITAIPAMDTPRTPMDGMAEATRQVLLTTMTGRTITAARAITRPSGTDQQPELTSAVLALAAGDTSAVVMAAVTAVAGIAKRNC